jgi:hypothetical protein
MSVTKLAPNTVWLGGPGTEINDLAAGAAITPGHLLERYVPSGTINRLRVHSTAAGGGPRLVARECAMLNRDVDTAYAAADLVEAVALDSGGTAWMFIASGQNIVFGALLESAGNGTLRVYNAGVVLFSALETTGAVTVQTRIRVEAV